jgi:hypothetical protein
LVAWANAPYAIVLGTVVLFMLLQGSGALGLLAGGDHHAGDDVDGEGADAHHEASHDRAHEHEPGRGAASLVLAPLGVGKLPLSLVWQVYGAIFALTGYALNAHFLGRAAGPPLVSMAWTLPIALGAGYAVVAGLARLLTPVVSDANVVATSRAELVGRTGTVISTRVDTDFGEVRFRDKTGHDLRLVCKLAPRHRSVREGESVVVVDHAEGTLYVASLEDALEESGSETAEASHDGR